MAQLSLTSRMDARNRILVSADTELKAVLLEGLALLDFDAEIRQRIEADIERAAREHRKARVIDELWEAEHTPPLFPESRPPSQAAMDRDADTFALAVGRPRVLDGEAVFVLMMCRGWLDSVTTRLALDQLRDSLLIKEYLDAKGMSLPSRSCLWAYLDAVSPETRERVHLAMVRYVAEQGLDDMRSVCVDSFSVSAYTAWPTDSGLVLKLLSRAFTVGSRMQEQYGVPGFTLGWVPEWLVEIKRLDFQISCAAGKPDSKRKVNALYRQLLATAGKVINRLALQLETLEPLWRGKQFVPSMQSRYEAAIGTVYDCLGRAVCVCQCGEERILDGLSRPASEKILSVSERTAGYIKKGGREAVVGYKPQLVRTANGFITVAELLQGNPADAVRLVPVIEEHIRLTGVVPSQVSADDGYTSRAGRDELLGLGCQVVSMSGSKAKALIPDQLWDSLAYIEARNGRSAIESAIWVLRCKLDLYRFGRRGLDAVRSELQEKVLVYNLWRCALVRARARQAKAA